uniref:Protein kinase domain-containing protein n=1 Tax=Phytophthora ramorum TaxID=164328 RepID=H3HEA7_PHYRM
MRRQRHQHAIEEEFQQTCPFRPKINNVSEEIVREKLDTAAAAAAVHGETRRPRNPHLELYENSFQTRALRDEREEEYFKQFPFKPDIGVNALWVAPDRSQSDFVERLAVDKYHELERKRIALHDKYAPDRDPHTGKELFKPEIGRAPAFSRNKQGLPIGDFLHAAHREQQEYHRRLREKDQRDIKKKSQQTFVSEASRQALERRKMDTCVRIFDKLLILSRQAQSLASSLSEATPELAKQNSDLKPQSQQEESNEAVIPAQVNLSSLPAEISRVVAIVFEYANHSSISRDAFSGYMDRLVREVPGVTYSQIVFLSEHLHADRGGMHRHQMHHSDPEREAALVAAEQKELTFHPVIDKNSREIATKHGRVASSKVFHALNQYYDHYLERKEQLRKQQQREFSKSHPFHPTFVTKAHQREPVANAFYDKIRTGNCEDAGNATIWRSSASVSSASASYRNVGGLAPPAPLQTAISNARPCVRPIESERSRFYTAATADEVQLDESSGVGEEFPNSMRASEVVHPVSGTTMAAPQLKTTFVLYSLVGEELEPMQESKPQHGPDTNWNAFVLPLPPAGGRVRLADVQKAFPLGSSFHFAFRCEDGAYLDLTNPESAVPFCGRKILARITPLDEDPSIPAVAKLRTESYGSSTAERRSHRPDDYEEFESTTYESQGSRQASEWTDASKDAQAYLRKQTEQAYDFAKKISIEDAKKGASETAKKAKKWGGSLLSTISATISSASANVSKSETIQVGGVSVQVVRLLAEGAYAQVLLVRSSATNETFALKRILCQSQEVENDVQMELQVFRTVKHLNIMPLVEFSEARVQQGMEFFFLVPYFDRGSLWDAIDAACQSSSPLWPFTQRTALHLFHGICSGVLALHRAGFCHRDIKPHNVLLSSSSSGEDFLAYIPVVTDFGSCAPIRVEVNSRRNSIELQDEANRKSSAPYRAPELFEPTVDVPLDGQSDVWSLGCVLYAMAFGTSPFEHPREGFMKLACLNGRVSFPPEQGGVVHHRGTQFSVEFCDFIRDMLHTNPEERPSVLDALEFTEELLNDEMQR